MPIHPDRQAQLAEWFTATSPATAGQPRMCLARSWREALGLSQEQAAIAVNVGKETYARWERGRTKPRWPHNRHAYRVINHWRQKVAAIELQSHLIENLKTDEAPDIS